MLVFFPYRTVLLFFPHKSLTFSLCGVVFCFSLLLQILGGEKLPAQMGQDPNQAVLCVLRHIVGLIQTYHQLFKNGVLFVIVIESNLYGFTNDFCRRFTEEARQNSSRLYANIRSEFNRRDYNLKLSESLFDHVRFYHDSVSVIKKFEEENRGEQLSAKGEMNAREWSRIFDTIAPPRGEFLPDQAGVFGTMTTSILKNQAFTRFSTSVLVGGVDFNPKFTSVVSSDIDREKELNSEDIINLIVHEMSICPKKLSMANKARNVNGITRDMEHRPGQVLYVYGKAARRGVVDDFPTIFALIVHASYTMALFAALSSSVSTISTATTANNMYR